jgi:UDP-N-acetylmuramyl pentapeptide phosphotransferase/UDP-N-acetylglucosamine-1-phosphate transferase
VTLAALLILTAAVTLLCMVLTWWLSRPGAALRILDRPNERSLHTSPIPRTGGVAILTAGCVGLLVAHLIWGLERPVAWIAAGTLALGAISFVEDRNGVARRYRLLVHVAAACLLPLAGVGLDRLELGTWALSLPPILGWVLTLAGAVWMTNLYNFMDGMDGFAAGMTLIGFATLALLGWRGGSPGFTAVAAVVSAGAAGFLVWNFPPARIFMGDTGSAPLGYLAAGLSLWGSREGLFPLWAAVLLFSPFIVDATVTLLRRALHRERIWEAHRSHYYQRLVRAGWGHRKTVLRAYLLMLACAAGALEGGRMTPWEQLWLLGSWGLIYLLLAYRSELLIREARDSRL